MARLGALVSKEVRELLRERLVLVGLIIMPAVIMAVMGGLQGAAVKRSVQQALKPVNVLIAFDSQPTESDLELARALARGFNASFYPGILQWDPSSLLTRGNYSAVIVFHRGIAENFSEGLPVSARVYVLVPAPTPTAQTLALRITSRLEAGLKALIAARIHEVFPRAEPSFLASPLRANVTLMVWGREVPAARYTGYIVALYAIPVALLILLTSAAQVGAISMGLEREAKTLEMLLASPVTHREVVLSKILGVLLVTLVGGASFTLGFLAYYESVKPALSPAGGGVVASLSGAAIAAALAILVLDLYIAAVLGLILGLGAQDVRGAQMVANYFSFLLVIPYFMVFIGYIPSPTGALGWSLLADPLYPPLLALLGAQFGRANLVVASLGAQAAHLLVWTIVAFKLLEPERLVAGVPLLRRLAARRGSFLARST
jgi:ABC-2 type transport system permease protein